MITAVSQAFVNSVAAGSWVAAGATAIAAVAVLLFLPARHRDGVTSLRAVDTHSSGYPRAAGLSSKTIRV